MMSDSSEGSGASKEPRRSASREYRPPPAERRPNQLAGSDFGGSGTSTPVGSAEGGYGGVPNSFPGNRVGYHGGTSQRQDSPSGESVDNPNLNADSVEDALRGSPSSNAGAPVAVNSGLRKVPDLPSNTVNVMPDWTERNGAVLMGAGIEPCPPFFQHGNASSNGWVPFESHRSELDEFPFIPVRAMCVNVPAECFTNDATRFVDWATPASNSVRVASVAAVLGLISTPLTKGWLSGDHEEVARLEATARPGDDQDGNNGDSEPKKPKRVNRYMTQSKSDPHQNAPMVVIGYEDIYDEQKETVLAIRIWHFVFDKSHSTSELARRLMDENAAESDHSGAAHQQNSLRKQTVVAAARASRALIGSSIETAKLESAAGMVYRHITNESVYKNMLPHYAGRSDKGKGRPPIDLSKLPAGTLNRRLYADPNLGCTHPLAIEWVFNAKRPDGLSAGLVHLDGTPMKVHPDQVRVESYFDIRVPFAKPNAFVNEVDDPVNGDSHAFRVPEWVGASEADGGRACFFFQSDPNKLNVFDMSLPHSIVGAIQPGRALQSLFKETFLKLDPDAEAYPIGGAALIDRFNNEMTGRDQWEAEAINAMADSMVGFDTFDCTTDQRLDARTAKRNAAKGLACYGQRDGDDHVIEPRQALKENAFTTSAVHSKVIAPWAAEKQHAIDMMEQAIRVADNYRHADTDKSDAVFDEVREEQRKFRVKHADATKELILLHIAKLESSFSSAFERESIPVGYRAVYDGLQEELRSMTDGTANLAVHQNMQITDPGRSVFGTLLNWIGIFFEDDCYVDGRSWGLMQELFFHCFEQFDEQTLLLIFCGPKGNGKTLRTERAQKAFVDGWIVMSGPSSAKAGMQGNSDSCNGCNCVYDEMIDELTAGDGDARIEYWKQILVKREFNYMKAVVVRGSDGREMHRTYKLRTPHNETHIVCTNRGPAFTRGSEEPSDGKQALLDRSIVLFVRTEGKKTHDDNEFATNMAQPEVRKKVRTFRILTCLTALLKMLIFRQSFMRPDTALAQKMWDQWDEGLDRKFGLPRPTPRKNVKRLSNLVTMCCLNAVAHVFLYKQTVHEHEAGQVTEKFPRGLPFKMSMLAQCIPLLQPTPEMIHCAWSMGLEYSIGTSAMGMCGMSIMAEAAGKRVGDWMTRLPSQNFDSYLMLDSELQSHAADHDPSLSRPWSAPSTNTKLPELEKLFQEGPVSVEECRKKREQLRKKREMREEYKYNCSRGGMQNATLRDASRMLDEAIDRASPDTVIDSMDVDDDEGDDGDESASFAVSRPSDVLQGVARGKALYKEGNADLPEEDDADVQHGFHCERARDYPGSSNCALTHEDTAEDRLRCPYCATDEQQDAAVDGAVIASRLSSATSCIWPDTMEACMFYKPQILVQWAAGSSAFMEPGLGGSVLLGTRSNGSLFEHKKRGNGPSGAQRVDVAWLQAIDGEWAKSWRKTADYIKNQKSHTIDMFDVHRDGLGELLWLLSTKDNSRRIAEEPRLMASARPEHCVLNSDDKRVKETDVIIKMAPFADPRPGHTGYIGNTGNKKPPEHLARDECAHVEDTEWQRRLDTLMHAGRLAALNPLISNRVVVSPPIRMNPESGIEINVGAVHAHTLLLAESVLACATMPGLRNAQEPFCNGQSGPEGLSMDRMVNSKKRMALDADKVHMLPYSYDIVSIAIAEDAAMMMYNDREHKMLVYTKKVDPTVALTFEELPQLSMRYLGYSEHNRQTLTIRLNAVRREGQPYVEAGDPSISDSHITEAHIRRSLGREVSGHAEMAAYIGRKQGARSMGSVKGDLFASSTWYHHSIKSLQRRGLIRGDQNEPAVKAFSEMVGCISMRLIENLCVQGDPDFIALKLTKTVPGTYDAMENVAEDGPPRHQKRRMDVENTVAGGIDFDTSCPAVFRALLNRPARAITAAGAGSSNDVIAMDDSPHPE